MCIGIQVICSRNYAAAIARIFYCCTCRAMWCGPIAVVGFGSDASFIVYRCQTECFELTSDASLTWTGWVRTPFVGNEVCFWKAVRMLQTGSDEGRVLTYSRQTGSLTSRIRNSKTDVKLIELYLNPTLIGISASIGLWIQCQSLSVEDNRSSMTSQQACTSKNRLLANKKLLLVPTHNNNYRYCF